MGWTRKDLEVPIPDFVKTLYADLSKLYNDTLVPLVGPNYPPELAGSIGPLVTDVKAIIDNLQSIIVDPLATVMKTMSNQFQKITDDLNNTAVAGIVIHPQNVEGVESISYKIDDVQVVGKQLDEMLKSLQSDASTYIDSRFKNLLTDGLFKINFKRLKPLDAIRALSSSLDDTGDIFRPDFSDSAYVFGVGFLFTAKTYLDFSKLINDVTKFINIDDLTKYAESIDKKINLRFNESKQWVDCITAWFDFGTLPDGNFSLLKTISIEELNKKYYPIYTKEIINKQYKDYLKTVAEGVEPIAQFAYPFDPDFKTWLKSYVQTNNTLPPVGKTGGGRPDWYGLKVKNALRPLQDLFNMLNLAIKKLEGFGTLATTAVSELFTVIEKRIEQIVTIISDIVSIIKKIIETPKFPGVYTIGFDGVGGNKFIKSQIENIDLTGVSDNDFTALVMFVGGSTSADAFKILGNIADEWVGDLAGKSILDKTSFTDITPDIPTTLPPSTPLSAPPSTEDLTLPQPESEIIEKQKINPVLPRRVLESINRKGGILKSPYVYRAVPIVDGETYPYVAPFWKIREGVVETATLRKDEGNPKSFTRGTTIEETLEPHDYTLRLDSLKENTLTSSSQITITIDPFTMTPIPVFPLNVQAESTYSKLPFAITWLEEAGVTVGAELKSTSDFNDFTTVYSPYFKNQPIFQNGEYTLRLKTTSNINPLLFETIEVHFFINSNAKNPEDLEIVGIVSGEIYPTNRTISWSPESGTTVTARLKKDGEEFAPFTSGTTITDDGIYTLEVKVERTAMPTFYIEKILTFAIDKVAPEVPVPLMTTEVIDGTFASPFTLYWEDVDGAVSEGYLKKDAGQFIRIYSGSILQAAGSYEILVKYISKLDGKISTTRKLITLT